ncbi:hypothetical protein GGS26DRAFT_568746 [Hypomontagnella submonticulosa]|nr:hypothetical protein GGS26DRAFT_568746 [Hypomontagnella submonticulosa]
MRRWIPCRIPVFTGLRGQRPKRFSAVVNDVERISIRNGSSGTINIDLHNIAKVSSSDPLLVYLPPYSTAFSEKPAQLPRFIQRWPTAVINYRWAGFAPFEASGLPVSDRPGESGEDESTHLSWPAPIHDTARAYDWIVDNLGPSNYSRRDIYIYGSYLGASLATSLALTETHPHHRMGVRGCVAYNGIYNWTMFLPDHPINKAPKLRSILEEILARPADLDFQDLKQHAQALFGRPDNLFDPFASSCLFFHTPGLFVPPSFDASALAPPTSLLEELDRPAEELHEVTAPSKSPRKSPLGFPPRISTLKIPEMLLLHSSPPPLPPSLQRRRQRRKKEYIGNSFRAQAEELVGLMRRSIDKIELKQRFKWDDDFESWQDEAARRVQVHDVGPNLGDFELGGSGEEIAAAWLQDHANAKGH